MLLVPDEVTQALSCMVPKKTSSSEHSGARYEVAGADTALWRAMAGDALHLELTDLNDLKGLKRLRGLYVQLALMAGLDAEPGLSACSDASTHAAGEPSSSSLGTLVLPNPEAPRAGRKTKACYYLPCAL